ncbi:MAG: cytochrome c [Myxococcota bacterium]
MTRIGIILCALLLGAGGCRGWSSNKPPVHVNPNMDTQPKGKPYRASTWFQDKRTMRPLPRGVVPRGKLDEDDHLYRGLVKGKPADTFPASLTIDEAFVRRGQQRFNIACASCHSAAGDGNGPVGVRLRVRPPSFHTDYARGLSPGHVFDVITNGIRTMPAQGDKVTPADRWAIAAYMKALQLSPAPKDTARRVLNNQAVGGAVSWR